MTNMTLKGLAVLSALVLMCGPAAAQSVWLKAQIPFDFNVGDQKLEAGEYRITVLNGSVLTMQRSHGPGAAAAMTNGVYSKGNVGNGQLIFRRYGSDYFLSQAFWPGYETGRELLKSSRELEAEARNGKPEKQKLSGSLVRR